jgi:hypothetical protein
MTENASEEVIATTEGTAIVPPVLPEDHQPPVQYTVEQIKEMAEQVKQDNIHLIKELASLHVQPENLNMARVEMLLEMMIEVGMIPSDFMAAFDLRWEQNLNSQLRNIRKQALDAKREAEKEAFRQNIVLGTNINPKTLGVPKPEGKPSILRGM